MADNTSLFGGMMSPQEMQQQLIEQRALQFANLGQNQRLAMLGYKAGAGVGQGLGGLFGVDMTDPTIQRATKLREMASQYNTNTAAGLRQMAAAIQSTDPDTAWKIQQQANALELNEAKLTTERATAASKLREGMAPKQKIAQALADSQFERGTPEWTTAYRDSLVAQTTKAVTPHVSSVGVTNTTREPVYFDAATSEQFTIQNGKRIPYSGQVDKTTSKTTVNVDAKGETAFAQELGKLDAKRVNDAVTARDNAASAINSLNKLASLPSQELITGQFASGRVGATNLLATLGLASPADAQKLATSQQYQKVAGDVILQTLGGKLGSGFSNADREFIAGLVPQLETNPEARRKLIQFMQGKNQDIIKEASRLEKYARDNKGLKGFESNIPLSVTPTGKYSGLSDEELDARIKALQKR